MPWVLRFPAGGRRTLGGSFLLAAVLAAIVGTFHSRHRALLRSKAVCHPNLSHLRNEQGHEVLLIGMTPLDLEGASTKLVQRALQQLRPDVVMVEGFFPSAVNAMMLTGKWETHGISRPGLGDWTDIGNSEAVELPRPKKRGWGWFAVPGQPVPWLERSLVPVKVGSWAKYLRGSVGGAVAAAVQIAASRGIPLRFLGPADGGMQGFVQVAMLAQRAAMELLEEEHSKGVQLSSRELDAPLRRAQSRILEDTRKWQEDARAEHSRLTEFIENKLPQEARVQVAQRVQALTSGTAARISSSMKDYRRGGVVLAADQLVMVEKSLKEAGYHVISQCA